MESYSILKEHYKNSKTLTFNQKLRRMQKISMEETGGVTVCMKILYLKGHFTLLFI